MFINLNTGIIGVQANLEQTLTYAQQHGFSGIDISIAEVADLAEKESIASVQARFDKANIRFGGWGLPVNYRQDEATWQAGLAELPRYAATAQSLGCDRCYTFIMPCSDELDFGANFAFHVQRLQPIAQILSDHGIRFGLEFVGPKTLRDLHKYDFVHSLDGIRALNAAIGTVNMGILVDSYHLYTSHSSLDDLHKVPSAEIVNVHVNDAPLGLEIDEQLDDVRDLPGATGVIDLSGFLQALQKVGYDGPIAAEPFSQRLRDLPDSEAVAETGEAMMGMWDAAGV